VQRTCPRRPTRKHWLARADNNPVVVDCSVSPLMASGALHQVGLSVSSHDDGGEFVSRFALFPMTSGVSRTALVGIAAESRCGSSDTRRARTEAPMSLHGASHGEVTFELEGLRRGEVAVGACPVTVFVVMCPR
jgi:hypothetical protein